jgi:hypothetical protein
MYVVKNSAHALLVALIPLAVVHAVLVAMAVLGTQAVQPTEAPAPDQVLVFYVTRLAIDGSLLFAGHYILRQQVISSRIAYALMGGVAAAAGYAIAMRNSLQMSTPTSGAVLTIGLLPTIAGMFAGFLYGQFAGLAPSAAFLKASDEGLTSQFAFDGPTRVRTSVAAIAIAATIPTVLTSVLSVTVFLLMPAYIPGIPGFVVTAAIPAQLFLTILVTTILPSTIFVLSLHHIARSLHRHRAIEYAALGGLMALGCAYLLSPFTPLTSISYLLIPAAGYGAIMGALYRRFAGIEPVPLPEAVIATDMNALVDADHPARRQHPVILSN